MDTKDFFRTKSDRAFREKHYKKNPDLKKEIDNRALDLTQKLSALNPGIGQELSMYGYCLLVRQDNEVLMVNREKFTVGYKMDGP